MSILNKILFFFRFLIILLYSFFIDDFNIILLFFFLEFISFLFIRKSNSYLLLNTSLLVLLFSSIILDFYREFQGGVSKSGNELTFFDIISTLSSDVFNINTILEFYIFYEDILFISLNVFLFKLLYLKDFFNLVFLNNYLASWSVILVWKLFKVASIKSGFILTIGVLLFYSSTGLRDILGLFLFSCTFYIFKNGHYSYKFFFILLLIVLQYFIRPINSFLLVSFIASLHFLKNFQVNSRFLFFYLIVSIMFLKIIFDNYLIGMSDNFFEWNQSHKDDIIYKSSNSILANLRFSNFGFFIPLLFTLYGENLMILFKFSSFSFEFFLLWVTSAFNLINLGLLFKYLFLSNKYPEYNLLFIICSLHSILIFFLTDETRHRLFFILIISFIHLINHFNESSTPD